MSVWAGLIERLSNATGPDRELDMLIAWYITPSRFGAPRDYYRGMRRGNENYPAENTDHFRSLCISWAMSESYEFPAYTSSLDAALTLVPAGLDYELLRTGADGPPRSEATVHMKPYMKSKAEDEMRGEAATDALALCIASIKARASHGVDEPG